MGTKQVSVGRAARSAVLATAVLTMGVWSAAAQTSGTPGEKPVKVLGGSTRFSQPMRDITALRTMVGTNRDNLTQVLGMVGLSDLSTQLLDALSQGNVTETTVPAGTHLEWMALKRRGRPDVLRNIRWAGRTSFDAFAVNIEANGYRYTFVLPKVCGNLSLVGRVAIPVTSTAEVAPPPPPPAPPAPVPEPEPIVSAPPPPPAPAVAPPPPEKRRTWVASGFVGSNLSTSTANANLPDLRTNASWSYGGQLAWLWRDYVGLEGIADFAPTVELDQTFDEAFGFQNNHDINAYMANVIAGWRIGHESRYQPFLSGGIGSIQFHGDVINESGETENLSRYRIAGNVGGGVMAFAGAWGFRTDVRWYRATQNEPSNDPDSLTETLTKQVLSGLTFWRANMGVALRW